MLNPENEILRALINYVLPSAIAGAVVQIATRVLANDLTFTGAILSISIALGVAIPLGLSVYFKWGLEAAIITASVSSLISRDLAGWFVYGIKLDRALNTIIKAVVDKIVKIFK